MHSMSYKLVTAVDLTVLVGALFFFFLCTHLCVSLPHGIRGRLRRMHCGIF